MNTAEHFEVNKEALLFDSLKGTGVKVELDHLDLKQDTAYYIDKLEKFEIQCEVET
ncbi:MAG: hypothetical protein GQ559_09640 [Desulfobulbaceae bacterium]|nr:hypothetical protein [Desulfobulbaceae bacterium]